MQSMHNKVRCVNVAHSYLPNVVVIQSASWSQEICPKKGPSSIAARGNRRQSTRVYAGRPPIDV